MYENTSVMIIIKSFLGCSKVLRILGFLNVTVEFGVWVCLLGKVKRDENRLYGFGENILFLRFI